MKTATSAAAPAAAAYHARAAWRPWAPAAYSASHPAYGGTPGTATALTAYADTHTASTLTGRDRRQNSATPPISAAASPTTSPATPARRSGARTELTARGPASCSAVTSTTSSTLPARAQRRRGAGGLTAAPVSHPQRTRHEAFPACHGLACRGTPDYPIPSTAEITTFGSRTRRSCRGQTGRPPRHRPARYAGRFRGRWDARTGRSVPLAHDEPGIDRQRVFGGLEHFSSGRSSLQVLLTVTWR